MDIQSLKVYVSEQDLQKLADEFKQKFQPAEAAVKKLTVKATPDGVRVSGEVQTPMLPLSFDSVWQPSVTKEGRVTVALVGLSAAGFPATPLRALVLGILKDAIKEPFLQVTEDAIVVDVQEFVHRESLPVALTFEMQTVRCVEGGLFIEAGMTPTV